MPASLIEIVVRNTVILGSFGFIGGGLKYIDQVYDVGVFNKYVSYFIAIFTALFMGFLIAFDPHSSAILISIILAVGITGKLDNLPFKAIAFTSIAIPALMSVLPFIPEFSFQVYWLPLAILVGAAILDEYIDEFGDQRNIQILTWRPVLKITLFGLCIINAFDWIYFFALLAFDMSYLTVRIYSNWLVRDLNHIRIRADGIVPN